MSRAEEKTLDYIDAYAIMMDALDDGSGDLDAEESEQIIAWEEDGEVSAEWRFQWKNTVWDLERVPVADPWLWVDTRFFLDNDKVAEYVRMDARTAPPILLHPDGHPLDGQHRLLAAIRRGDKTILAWVPRTLSRGRAVPAREE